MLNRFSSLKSLNHLPVSLSCSTMSSLSAVRNPTTYLPPTFQGLIPTRPSLSSSQQKNTLYASKFLTKSQEKAKELFHELIHMVVHGSKSAYKDAKSLYSIVSSKSKNDYSVEEIREVKRITVDLIKFIPFYASIIIPAGELALIPYLFLFPRAVPSYFMTEKTMKENKEKLMDKQFQAHQHLKQHLLNAMSQLGYDISIRDPESLRKFFVENKEKLLPLLSISKMDSELLKSASDFLMFEYIEGTYIMNLLYKTTVNLPKHGVNLAMWAARSSYRASWSHPVLDYSFKMNSFVFERVKRKLLRYQFEKQFKSWGAQNYAITSDLYGQLREETVLDVAKERGFYSVDGEQAKNWLCKEWKQVTETHIDDAGMPLFWQSIIQYESL